MGNMINRRDRNYDYPYSFLERIVYRYGVRVMICDDWIDHIRMERIDNEEHVYTYDIKTVRTKLTYYPNGRTSVVLGAGRIPK